MANQTPDGGLQRAWRPFVLVGLLLLPLLVWAVGAIWRERPEQPAQREPLAFSPTSIERTRGLPEYDGPPPSDELDVAYDRSHEYRHADRSAEYREAERRAVATAKLRALADLADEAYALLDELEHELDTWDRVVHTLLSNELGELIAGRPELVREFDAIYNQGRPPASRARAIRERVDTLLAPIQEGLQDDPTAVEPSPELVEQLTAEQDAAVEMLQVYRDHRQMIDDTCSQALDQGVRASTDLQAAITELHKGYRREEQEKIVAAAAEARKINAERLARAEYDKVIQQGLDEEARIRQDTANSQKLAEEQRDKTKTLAAAEAERIRAEAERQRLLKLAQDPAVQAKYAPFLTHGKYMIGTSPKRFHQIPQPVSYSRLQRMGALRSPLDFANVGAGQPFGWNDRPHWKTPSTQQELEQYTALLQQFRELAPIWVELGLLQP